MRLANVRDYEVLRYLLSLSTKATHAARNL